MDLHIERRSDSKCMKFERKIKVVPLRRYTASFNVEFFTVIKFNIGPSGMVSSDTCTTNSL